ncbi:hypothetical protein, partial [Phocaeicola vulgatus]|uniref:hypothetical protein n=4 Tax=Phocaeicola vulgatus TaxID=821 RepID=UPI001C381C7D
KVGKSCVAKRVKVEWLFQPLVGSNSKTLNKEKLSYPLKKRDISFQRIHFFYYICISLLKIEDL